MCHFELIRENGWETFRQLREYIREQEAEELIQPELWADAADYVAAPEAGNASAADNYEEQKAARNDNMSSSSMSAIEDDDMIDLQMITVHTRSRDFFFCPCPCLF